MRHDPHSPPTLATIYRSTAVSRLSIKHTQFIASVFQNRDTV